MSKKDRKGPKPQKLNLNPQIPLSRVRNVAATSTNIFLKAQTYPIYGCWLMEDWQMEGMTPVVIARKTPDDEILVAVYLLDLYCLGVKNALTKRFHSVRAFENALPKLCSYAPEAISVEMAHQMVYGALAYARCYGFEPHKDFYNLQADKMLDPEDAHPRTNNIVFGKNGKPHYHSGPYDSPMRIQQIISTLERTAGKGNYDVVIQLGNLS